MTDIGQLDQTFHFIMETFVKRGDAPHYTEIAGKFGVLGLSGKSDSDRCAVSGLR